tara:strand:- start:97 stop:345 length:249 start_codon:yes stop_codon:yes gene_type:complete
LITYNLSKGKLLEPITNLANSYKDNIMDIKKEKRPTKKGLINEIETLDSNKVFNLLSLTRTNIENLIAVRDLLRGGKNDTSK